MFHESTIRQLPELPLSLPDACSIKVSDCTGIRLRKHGSDLIEQIEPRAKIMQVHARLDEQLTFH